MVTILAIGNSFSEDATCYLNQIAEAAGIGTYIVNLYIGGCSLEQHWQNMISGEALYQYQENGAITERYVSIEEVLKERSWDYIVTQQCSADSGWKDSYEPFLENILGYLRERVPGAKIRLHETWAYEINSPQPAFWRYHRSQQEMYRRLSACYCEMSLKYNLPMIPCGDVLQRARLETPFCVQNKGLSLCRDGQHVSFLYGRYLLACVWAKCLLGIYLADNSYLPYTDQEKEEADEELVALIRSIVDGYPYRITVDGRESGTYIG